MGIWQQFQAGGPFMYGILLFGFFILGFIIERFVSLYRTYKEAPSDLRQKILAHVAQGDFTSAMGHIEMVAKQAPLGKIARVGCKIRQNGGGEEELQARMDEQLSAEISKIDRRNGFLAMFGNVSTLLGLLGTVTGLIISFAGVANANPAERAILLGKGISEALNSTAFGLLVAIPALVAYAIYQNRTDRLITRLTEDASEIYHDLLFYSESRKKTEAEGVVGKKRSLGKEKELEM
ncbi:MAG: MotA/TolQ/ExbB proton channel family protein [Halobacteriovoraceae bacterium]|nr:MotA/TolQ/ExbB proton channel family protein [Halobacteriovoraceae bacterium]